MNLLDCCKDYFEAFANKDIDALTRIYSDEISLRDWDINVSGKEDVLSANREFFANVDTIRIEVLKAVSQGTMVANELEISINDGAEMLLVVDIIEFNSDRKITGIRAYKG